MISKSPDTTRGRGKADVVEVDGARSTVGSSASRTAIAL